MEQGLCPKCEVTCDEIRIWEGGAVVKIVYHCRLCRQDHDGK